MGLNKILKFIGRITDINTYALLHKRVFIRQFCQLGKGVKITSRAELLHHGNNKNQIILSNFVILDGILEVYEKGFISIGDYTYIGRSRIFSTKKVIVGSYCLVSDNVCIMDSNLHPISAAKRIKIAEQWAIGNFPDVYTDIPNSPVILEDYCWIGFGSAILKGVHIGQGAIVGSNSVVTENVPPWTIVAGNPARVIREIPENER